MDKKTIIRSNKATSNHNKKSVITFVVLGFIICLYPLIYQLFPLGSAGTLNKVLLFVSLLIYAVSNPGFRKQITSTRINMLLSLSMLYILCSIILYSGNMAVGDVFRELLYTLAPVLFYFIAETFSNDEQEQFKRVVVVCLCFVIFVGILDMFGLNFSTAWENALEKKGKANFISYFSPITMGYVAQFLYALTLYKRTGIKIITNHRAVFLVFFLLISILTLQRAAYLGIIISSLLYIGKGVAGIKRKQKITIKRYSIVLSIVVVLAIIMIAFCINWESVNHKINDLLGFDLGSYVKAEIDSFSLLSVQHDRQNQAIIFNNHNVFNIIFGEGYGKYSPNNMNSICRMPDASYHRIYNELGIIGAFLFFIPYLLMLFEAVLKRKTFAVYFILFTFIAFYFNRVIWAIPISYIIYPMLSICRKHDSIKDQ